MLDLLGLLPEEVDELVGRLQQPRYRADQILDGLYRGHAQALDDLRQLPSTLMEALRAEGWRVAGSTERARVESADGLTTKLLLELDRGTEIETVLMRYRRGDRVVRSSVCVSTQAGCAMACAFCATGQMGFARNLEAAEIVCQAIHFSRLLKGEGARLTHVTFMGMGEPLANYDATLRAVRLITDPRALGLSGRSVTVSTVGLVNRIDRLAAERLQINLAISLHAPNDGLRRRLVPTAAPSSVGDLVAAARRYRRATGRRVTYQYAVIEGVNDLPEHAAQLAALLRGSDSHVNLIPLNPTAGEFRRPSRRRVSAFQGALRARGVNATVRSEKGIEIAAACGQLRTDVQQAAGASRRGGAQQPATVPQ